MSVVDLFRIVLNLPRTGFQSVTAIDVLIKKKKNTTQKRSLPRSTHSEYAVLGDDPLGNNNIQKADGGRRAREAY